MEGNFVPILIIQGYFRPLSIYLFYISSIIIVVKVKDVLFWKDENYISPNDGKWFVDAFRHILEILVYMSFKN